MRLVLAFLALAHVMTACNRRDEAKPTSGDVQLRNRMTGSWFQNDGHLKGMLTLAADGSFSAGWTNVAANPTRAWTFEGNWQIANGVCAMKLTKSRSWNITNSHLVGSVEHWRIVRADDQELVWVSESVGQTNTLTRRK